jgi:uncharacterized repeat protein (TIGR02543 family)
MAQKRAIASFGWATLLLLLACKANAQVPDFVIYNGNTPLTGNQPVAEVYYGQTYAFSVRMASGGESGYKWSWCEDNQKLCPEGESYSFLVSQNISGDLRITVKAEKGSEFREKYFTLRIISTYVVSFNPDGGLPAPQQQPVLANNRAGEPAAPAKAGYNFLGWFEDGANLPFNFASLITKNITLTAKWELIRYTITYNDRTTSWERVYTVIDPPVPMPQRKDTCGYKFEGWFDNPNFSGLSYINDFIPANNLSNKTFYAKWPPKELQMPSADLLDYSIPVTCEYNGSECSLLVKEKQTNECEIGEYKVLYEGSDAPPKDVGEYKLSVRFDGSDYYIAANIDLQGMLKIEKKSLTGPFVLDFFVENKDYDGTQHATVRNPAFRDGFPSYCFPEEGTDYSIAAEFESKNAGANIPVTMDFKWLPNAPVRNNCSFNENNVVFYRENISATINKANLNFDIIAPEIYRLSSPGAFKPRVVPDFVSEESIIWEYKKESETEFSDVLPYAIGSWQVRAILEETDNYYEARVVKSFAVTRGSSEAVVHRIKFKETGFEKDASLSSENKAYFVAGSENCGIENAVVQIEVAEPDIKLKNKDGDPPNRYCEEDPYCEEECTGSEECYMRHYIPVAFGKPGLDTIVYSLYSTDGIFSEQNILIIETPVPFDSVVKQKWNNTLYVNNNPQTNGGYSFTDFTWLQNDKEVSILQFYSAGPKSTDKLETSDIYIVQMYYLKNNEKLRISTCEGSPKIMAAPVRSEAAFKKQVLGIDGKTASAGAKIYNSKGCAVSGNAPGIYLVEEK